MAEEDIETEEVIETQDDAAETEEVVSEAAEGEDDELVVSIGEASPPQEEDNNPDWIRDLRKAHREAKKENRELKARLEGQEEAKKKRQIPQRPVLADSDFDEEVHAEKLIKWADEVREVEAEQAAQQAQAKEQQKSYEKKFTDYQSAAKSMKVPDFEDAEEAVKGSFSDAQQGLLVHGASRPELLIYALGKDAKRAKELSSIADPVQFAFAAGKLEAELKVTSRKPKTQPERRVSGSTGAATADTTLDRLRAEAAKTGDSSKVLDYKRKMRQAS